MKPTTSAIFASLFALATVALNPAMAQVGKQQGLVDPNRATAEDLAKLPGVNGELAALMVEKRPHLTMAKLDAFLKDKLDDEERKALYTKTFVHLNLNTATRAEILMIPNMGNRMAHEFEEYRPYVAMAQFRREMRKYVDDKEVTRLEQFVFVPMDLNTATDEAFLTIPGLGNRMLHEFKEYRPYKSIEQFRREMGKYVDEKEVARLERYVTIAKTDGD